MEALEPYLPVVWLFIIGFLLLYYAVTDGFDMGVGVISLFARDEEERGLMMAGIESIWHDNQTWLVLLGGMMFGAFPRFYGIVLSSLYIPMVAMLFGLILRGVSFEFRHNSPHKRLWGLSFGLGSLIAAMGQGFALGGLLGGVVLPDERFAGSVWGWLTPFSALVVAGVLAGYTMLGANYLILKMTGEIQERSYRYALLNAVFTLGISVAVHLWIISLYPNVAQKWRSILSEGSYEVAVFPAFAGIAFVMYFRSIIKRQELAPLLWNIGIVLFSFTGLSVGMYPHMIPNLIASPMTVHAAAASPETLWLMLVVTAVLLPVILTYTTYKYRTFRGKTTGHSYTESGD